jgi:hypothetical protein
MYFELWDQESGNSLGDYDSEAEALAIVRDMLAENEPDYADMLSLGCTQDDGTFAIVASGASLAARAQAASDTSRRSG